ncbi:sulfatase-like hydrolase/transferase [Coraliomargarita algicola]|uniref:Sulfatase-like hydrolase/transferase n=1 Tax=Coraliomargarita algicola TaxID=3092156 RepID=A0ABZ0RQ47_9BACT|nr:sulfatase-like hydrolase/transferase [Coraliomargarita sp. J2-16]WPJ97273.1 sulfatase-like hydrolase/transferase [Coraliomargarita sp. J2-16]
MKNLIVGCYLLSCAAAFGSDALTRPNILVLIADDHRKDLIGKYHDIVVTPALDDLCDTGVFFNNAYATTPICAASRASIFTGLTERTHGYTFGESAVPAQFTATAYPKMLKENGYRTGFVGKFGCELSETSSERFDYYEDFWRTINKTYNGEAIPQTYYKAQKARDFIEDAHTNHAGTPWCMSVSFWDPHAFDHDLENQYYYPPEFETLYDDVTIPDARISDDATFNALPDFIKTSMCRTRWGWRYETPEKYQRMVKRHYRSITGVDKGVQMIRDKLTELGIADNTVIIYMGDNGYMINERQLAGKWLGWDECLQVPLIIYDPRDGGLRGAELDQVALNIDLAPTILELAGIDIPDMYQGKSLYPLLSGENPPWRNEFFFEHYFTANGQIPRSEGVRTDQWKYVKYPLDNFEQLYDLQADPGEVTNLAGNAAYADELALMQTASSAYVDLYSNWPPEEPELDSGYVDNTDAALAYYGTWTLVSDFSEDYNGSMHYADAAGESVEYTFNGDSIQVGVRKGASGGLCDVYLDGVLVANDVDTYASAKVGQVIIYEFALTNGAHTIKLEATGTKNPSASGSNIMFDFFRYTEGEDGFGGLDEWTHTVILDNGNTGTQNTSTWQTNATDGSLELITTDYDAIEQHAYIRSGATLAVGQEAQISLSWPLSGANNNDSFGLYVGGTAPTFNVRQDYVNIYGKAGGTVAYMHGFDGTTQYGPDPSKDAAGADTLFVARTADNLFELGFYVGATRTVVGTRSPTTANSADFVGIYADTRANGTLSGIEAFQITSIPVEPPPVVAQPSNKKIYVILFGGQSNAVGWGYHQYLLDEAHPLAQPQTDVEMYAGCGLDAMINQLLPLQSGTGSDWNNPGTMQYPALTTEPVNRFGPELSMARTVRDGIDILDSKVIVIKYGVGGTALANQWYGDGTADRSADGPVYQAFQTTVHAGIAAIQTKYPYHEVEIIGMGWVQGESDRYFASGYEAKLTTFIADVRATFATNMPFVLSRLSMNQIEENDAYYDDWQIVRAAQAAVAAADPLVVATETEGANYLGAVGFADGQIHFLSSALVQIGEDLGQALLTIATLDADGDQLPDHWEQSFTPPGSAGLGNAPDDDYDGDGITDRNEFQIGTSPVDPEDGLSLSISNAVSIQWSAKRGISYNLQHSTNLVSWSVLDTIVLETNGVAVLPLSGVVSNQAEFFRLKVDI